VATVFSHAVAGLALSVLARAPAVQARLGIAAVFCSIVPDIDVLGIWLGIRWGHVLGHRGITHSLAFAAVLAAAVVAVAFHGRARGQRLGFWLALFAATASHGVLDAMTDGGLGVAFFAPFDRTRYFLPWRPIPVSPIGVSQFFGERGLAIMRVEVVLIWVPSVLLLVATIALRWCRRRA
jgi:inner membrane protein